MPAVKTNIVIEQGADWAYGWAVTYNGTPIDATWSARSQIRAYTSAPGVLYQFAADVTAEGAVVIAVTPEESSAWVWRNGVYDVEVFKDGVATLRVAEGAVTVSLEVTR